MALGRIPSLPSFHDFDHKAIVERNNSLCTPLLLFYEETGTKHRMAIRIQRTWRKIIANPAYQICRRRLQRECENDIMPPRLYSNFQKNDAKYEVFRRLPTEMPESIFDHYPFGCKPSSDVMESRYGYTGPFGAGFERSSQVPLLEYESVTRTEYTACRYTILYGYKSDIFYYLAPIPTSKVSPMCYLYLAP